MSIEELSNKDNINIDDSNPEGRFKSGRDKSNHRYITNKRKSTK